MKDRYTGDIGDFAKIILLNEINSIENVNLGINWYYNNREYSYEKKQDDGKHIDYLKSDSKNLRQYAPNLYRNLLSIIDKDDRKIENLFDLINIRADHHFKVDIPYKSKRYQWISDSLDKQSEQNLLFLDPDNGIAYNDRNGNVKHVLQREIIQMYNSGKSLIIYNHRDRKSEKQYLNKFITVSSKLTPRPKYVYVLRASINSVRDYVFFLHEPIEKELKKKFEQIQEKYSDLFTKIKYLNKNFVL